MLMTFYLLEDLSKGLLELADHGRLFQVKDMGELHYFLGVTVKQNFETGTCTQTILQEFGLEHCKPAATPVAQGTKLWKATEDSKLFDDTLYRSAVGMLHHL